MHLTFFFFFNDTATTEIYTLSLHDALPISQLPRASANAHVATTSPAAMLGSSCARCVSEPADAITDATTRSEEHTSELQSLTNLVCRLLLEKKKNEILQDHACREVVRDH